MAIPDDQTLQHEILQLLASVQGGRMSAANVYDVLAARHPELTYEECSLKYRNSTSEWANRVQWARQHLVQRGFVFKPNAGLAALRGVWIITDAGREYMACR